MATFFASAATRRAATLEGEAEPTLYTVSADGALHAYAFTPAADAAAAAAADVQDDPDAGSEEEDAPEAKRARPTKGGAFARGTWALAGKHYFSQNNTRLTAADYHAASGLLVSAFSNGTFLLHALPAFEHLQTLSISSERVSSARFNARGDWIALGCAALGQLLVWEWRSETYVLKQQGHFFDVAALAFSPDGTQLASGADDARVKVWAVASGTCFVTFSEHRAAVTGVAFTPSGNAVLSSSLDGTVRAFDLVRCAALSKLNTNWIGFWYDCPRQVGCLLQLRTHVSCAQLRSPSTRPQSVLETTPSSGSTVGCNLCVLVCPFECPVCRTLPRAHSMQSLTLTHQSAAGTGTSAR